MTGENGHGLLALLDVADMNGDELTEALRQWTDNTWRADRSEVGETLDRFAHDGLVTVMTRHGPEPGAPATATYTLTSAGRQALANWLAAAGDEDVAPRPELLARVLLSLPAGRERALQVVVRQRTTLTAALQTRRHAARQAARRSSAEPAPDGGSMDPSSGAGWLGRLPAVLVEDARFTRAEAELRWLDLCEARLNSSSGGPATDTGRDTEGTVTYGGGAA
jgi:DNA-binding PadR family transcriptional regulator